MNFNIGLIRNVHLGYYLHLVRLLFLFCQQYVDITVNVVQAVWSLFGYTKKSSRTGFVSCCSLSPLSDLGWAVQWGLLNTCSRRWTRGRLAEQRQHQMYASAESRQRRRKTEIQSHSPTALRDDAGGGKARWASPYCCDAPPTSCCIETVPRTQSFCQPTLVLVLTCMQYPLQTCMPKWRKTNCEIS